jgi:hypothetical protein
MKLALIVAIAGVAAAFANSAQAQIAVEDSSYRAQFYSNTDGQNPEPRNLYADDSRDWRSGNAMMLHHANEPDRYRYHGGPKSND